MGGSKGGDQTIGYNYIMTVLAGFGRGPENGCLAVEVDDKIAWVGEVTDSTPTPINKPNLFGGQQKEGGIQGAFRWLSGARDQLLPGAATVNVGSFGPVPTVTIPNIKTAIGGRVSELRGFTSFLYRGLVSSMNPYPKEWHFLRWRTTNGWFGGTAWYPEKAQILMAGDGHELESGRPVGSGAVGGIIGFLLYVMRGGMGLRPNEQVDNKIRAMNPAHMIYQVLTDPEWGANRQTAELDENSFILAANTLCAEGFGLCIHWVRQEDVETFIQSVIDHIVAVLYTDRATGKLVLKLVRNDYDPATVPLYDANSGLLEIEEDDSASGDEAINEIILKGRDHSVAGRGKDFEVRVHNVAARQAEGAISQTLSLPGIPTRALGLRRAQMELAIHAPGLKRFKLKLDRRAWKLTPGAVIRVSAPGNDIDNMILRIAEADHGASDDTAINVRAVEDVFGLPTSSFKSPNQTGWTPPDMTATPAAAARLIEAGYYDLLRRIGETGFADVEPTAAYIGQLAMSPGYAYQYDLASRVSGEPEFTVRARGSFTPRGLLAVAIAALDTDIILTDSTALDEFEVGEALILEDEVLRVDAVNVATLTVTVARGCLDTIPASHDAGAAVWSLDDDLVSDLREYAQTETVETKVLTRTSSDLLDEADAPTLSVTLVARHDKPYPPGDVKVDGQSIYSMSGAHSEPVLTFTDRDRLSQGDQLIEHGAPSVGPEAGVTYTVRVKTPDGVTTLRTETITSGWTYTAAMQAADGVTTSTVVIELESVRGGVVSWQHYTFTIVVAGRLTEDSSLRLTEDGSIRVTED
jgi:hypothetical protein